MEADDQGWDLPTPDGGYALRPAEPPPGVSAVDIWRELHKQRPKAPWDD